VPHCRNHRCGPQSRRRSIMSASPAIAARSKASQKVRSHKSEQDQSEAEATSSLKSTPSNRS